MFRVNVPHLHHQDLWASFQAPARITGNEWDLRWPVADLARLYTATHRLRSHNRRGGVRLQVKALKATYARALAHCFPGSQRECGVVTL